MKRVKEIAYCGILVVLALALSFMEQFIPLQAFIPLPGIKLGLANLVTLVALYLFKPKYAFAILIPRCLLGAVFGSGITGLLFSLSGGLLSLCVMAFAKKAPLLSICGVSVLGAAVHNIGQIFAAMVLMHSIYIGAYLPYLLGISVLTGLLTGVLCGGILKVLPTATLPAHIKKEAAQ